MNQRYAHKVKVNKVLSPYCFFDSEGFDINSCLECFKDKLPKNECFCVAMTTRKLTWKIGINYMVLGNSRRQKSVCSWKTCAYTCTLIVAIATKTTGQQSKDMSKHDKEKTTHNGTTVYETPGFGQPLT